MMSSELLGWCAPLTDAHRVLDSGYDFLEVPLSPFELQYPENLVAAKKAVASAPIPLLVFNWFYPQHFCTVGTQVDRSGIEGYLKRSAELMHHAGAKAAVLGSAWSRNVPQGFSRARAREQIIESLAWVSDAFAGSGVMIGIEAQNRKEANIITSLKEAVDYAREVDRPDVVRVMADFYHMDEESEPLSDLATFGEWIVHVQLADSGRLNPGTGTYDYTSFFDNLRAGGYSGTVSVECMVAIADEGLRSSEQFLRRFWARGWNS